MMTQKNFEQLMPMLSQIMRPLGYRAESYVHQPDSFGNGGAEFEKVGEFKFTFTLDRSALFINVRPLRGIGIFGSFDLADILDAFEKAGYNVYRRKQKTDEELLEYLRTNIGLLVQFKDQLRFPLFGGIVKAAKRGQAL